MTEVDDKVASVIDHFMPISTSATTNTTPSTAEFMDFIDKMYKGLLDGDMTTPSINFDDTYMQRIKRHSEQIKIDSIYSWPKPKLEDDNI